MISLENKINIIKKTKKRKYIPEDLKKYRAKHKVIDYETLLKDEILSFEDKLIQQLQNKDISGKVFSRYFPIIYPKLDSTT